MGYAKQKVFVFKAVKCKYVFEPGQDFLPALVICKFYVDLTKKKTQQNECAPSEHSDQPGRPPSLIRVFAVRMKKA